MPHKYVFCHATSRTQAGQIVDRLKAAHFSSNDISALFGDRPMSHEFAQVKHTKASAGTVAGAGAGGGIGAALGGMAGMGAFVIPGLGAFLAAGPIMAALSGAALGTVIGGILGGLIGLGIPASPREGRGDKSRLEDGNILISVHTENAAEITHAEVIFAHAGAHDICTTTPTAVPEDNNATEILPWPTAQGESTQASLFHHYGVYSPYSVSGPCSTKERS